jgi:6-phosphogluconolactonase
VYEREVRTILGAAPGEVPRLDLVLLGLGTDGHTASLFPGTSAVEERQRLVVANWVDVLQAFRITMTFPLVNAARSVAFLVSGADKAYMLAAVLEGSGSGSRYPAQLVYPEDGDVIWFVDRAAAGSLRS